jgi:hypothetical protein
MQKLLVEFKNVPLNTPLVQGSTSTQLNKEETLSVESKVLANNNPEVDPPLRRKGPKVRVYVLSKEGIPLMPCSAAKARKLLKWRNYPDGLNLRPRAKVIKRMPFTIQLRFSCENKVQPIMLGIDTGYGNIGFSVVTKDKELICGTVKLDSRTKERLDNRRMYRRGRRNKLWYRKVRFLNRATPKGWLSPSVERRYQTHLTLINKIKSILPISKISIEVAKFDIQAIMNPGIQGVEYQQGTMYGYQNVRAYLMAREKGLCEHCGKDFKSNPSHIHHRKPRSQDGSNRLSNLMLLHKICHIDIHKDVKLLKKYRKASVKSYKDSTFMSIIRKRFWKDIPDLQVTYGYITWVNRNTLGLEKSHSNDAFVIANGTFQERTKPFDVFQKHRNNRVLQIQRSDGIRIRRKRAIIQPGDLFWVKGKKYSSRGMHSGGRYIYCEGVKKGYLRFQDVQKCFHQGSLIWN